MAETFTDRFGLIQWGVGTDSPSRVDFNAAFLALNDRAAYDDGVTRAAVPTTEVVKGRYSWTSPDGTRKTLYRRDDAGNWSYAGGPTVPQMFELRPYLGAASGGPATTAAALTIGHPDITNAAGTIGWDGAATFARETVWDPNDATKGALHVGYSGAQDTVNLGRLHVRTRNDGERGLVLRAHGSGASNLLTVREPGGSDVFTIDAAGNARSRGLTGLGGAATSAAHSVTVAPTSNTSDAITNGLLLYGQASPADSKTIMRIWRELADTADILTVSRDSIALGRLPWGGASSGGTLTLAGALHNVRMLGYGASPTATTFNLLVASQATPENPATDSLIWGTSRSSITHRATTTMTQELSTAGSNLVLDRYSDNTGRFLVARRQNATEMVAALEADGRLQTGARWLAPGTMIDARASLKHLSEKRWAFPRTDGPTNGIRIDPQGNATTSLTFTFPAMQLHSVTACDLNLVSICETTFATDDTNQGLTYFLETYVSINGGTFNLLLTTENFQPTVNNGMRQTGDNVTSFPDLQNVPAGASIQVRVKITNNSPNDGAAMYIRAMRVLVEECLLTTYAT